MSIIKEHIEGDEAQKKSAVEGHETVTCRCVAYPWIRYGDVWVEDGTNKRYSVHKVNALSTYKQTTLVYSVEMRQIEYTDIMYSGPADAKVEIKDLYDSAHVMYTPQLEKELEDQALTEWEKKLNQL